MATENATKKGFGARFMSWYESYQGKKVVGMVYSLGASVVIVGALFKILHLPGASQMLFAGMLTEALLFAIGCLDKPHPEFHWEEVFPQLVDLHTVSAEEASHVQTIARPNLAAATGGAPAVAAAPVAAASASTPSAKAPALKDEDFQALKDGIADLAKTASQFSELGKVAQSGIKLNEKLAAAEVATSEYAAKLANAGIATDGLAQAANGLSGAYNQVGADMKSVADETKAFKAGVEQVGKNVSALNSVYELQLQTLNAQVEAQKNATAATKEAAEAQVAFAASTKQLQKQVADLNGIYGSMLNALA